ncbi:SGNH/GDSL hydrolase family protein [Clostridium swellfunianum]|uniref:SGNH/GDSL hydrolase family protein n=1 Tax=Clostridium swellfunianum TaxID=1367462 RepID=UPI00202E365B|nr:SGNH/GDSL hydrolase family protein [Clostridium swellfunianum]MCM0647151.1 SGNH/GDSL hydrolase family protein [Clostridium swellfunianum]
MELKESYNLVVFGDSITKGVVYDSEKSRYSNLKDCFVNLVGSSIKGTVYNAGRFGSTIIRGISKMYNDVLKKTPDIVLIEFGGNDCDFDWDEIAHKPDIEHKPNTDLSTFRDTLLIMIDTFRKSNITPVLMTLPPLDYKRYFKWITKGDELSEQNVLSWLGSEIEIYNWHKAYNEIIVEVSNRTKTLMVDVRSEFLKYRDYSRFLCIDGIHPNSEGHSLIAKVMLNFIENNYKFLLQGNRI